ncbi:MAG: WecB/TagA/CpsF family glycosyltransferase, partial [Deltaproteobacteria bacterium]|nr:WecB/TagA/CpsF family glycosyltransferase [Deltaproteobacteria bacterium]
MNEIKRVTLLGVPVDHVDMKSAINHIDYLIENNSKGNYILAVNPEKVMALQRDSSLKQIFEEASLLIPDGIGVAKAMRWLFGLKAKRVPGVELLHNICRESAVKGYKLFVY